MKSTSLVFASTLAFVLLVSTPVDAADTRASELVDGDAGKSDVKAPSEKKKGLGGSVSDRLVDEETAALLASKKWSLSATLSSSFVSGPWNAGGSTDTLTGSIDVPSSYNPSFAFALTLGGGYRFTDQISASASWSLSRSLFFCDTCGDPAYDGFTPGTGGSGSTRIIKSGDLSLRAGHDKLFGWSLSRKAGDDDDDDDVTMHPGVVKASLGLRVPASRDSLICNPFYGGITGSLGASQSFDWGTSVSLNFGVTKSFFKYPAPPVGNTASCTPELRGYDGTETLTGTVYPESYDGDRFATRAANASWALTGSLGVFGLHSWIALIAPKVKDGWFWKKFSTSFSIGVNARLLRADLAYTIEDDVLTGPVDVDRAHKPVVYYFPVSVSAGYTMHKYLSASLSWSNTTPQLLWDPGSYYRTIGYNSSITLALSGRY